MTIDRARLTPVDIGRIGLAVIILGLLIGPIYTVMNANVGSLGVGDAYLARAVIPAALLGVFVLIMATAVGGR